MEEYQVGDSFEMIIHSIEPKASPRSASQFIELKGQVNAINPDTGESELFLERGKVSVCVVCRNGRPNHNEHGWPALEEALPAVDWHDAKSWCGENTAVTGTPIQVVLSKIEPTNTGGVFYEFSLPQAGVKQDPEHMLRLAQAIVNRKSGAESARERHNHGHAQGHGQGRQPQGQGNGQWRRQPSQPTGRTMPQIRGPQQKQRPAKDQQDDSKQDAGVQGHDGDKAHDDQIPF